MTTYQSIYDIPGEVLANGGKWTVMEGIPDGIYPGQGFAAIEEGAANSAGLMDAAYIDPETGEPLKIYGSSYNPDAEMQVFNPRPGTSIYAMSGEIPPEMYAFIGFFAWVLIKIYALLAAHYVGTLIFIALMSSLVVGAYVVNKIMAPKFGRLIQENADGSSVFESADGSMYTLNPDGSYSKIRDPVSTFGDLGTIIKYGVIGGVGIGLLYLGANAYSSYKHKTQFRAPAFEYLARGVADTGRSAAGALKGAMG